MELLASPLCKSKPNEDMFSRIGQFTNKKFVILGKKELFLTDSTKEVLQSNIKKLSYLIPFNKNKKVKLQVYK